MLRVMMRLQRGDDLRAGVIGSTPASGIAACVPLPTIRTWTVSTAAIIGPRSIEIVAGRRVGPDVLRVGRVHLGLVHDATGDHALGAVAPLLAGLEIELDRPELKPSP